MNAVLGAVWFCGAALMLGGAVAIGEASPRLVRAWRIAVVLALAAGGIELWVEAHELADGGAVGSAEIDALLRGTRFGRVWLARNAALALGLVPLFAARGALRRLGVALAATIALGVSPLSSHSAGGEEQAAQIAVHAAHLVAFALWLGGLGALLLRESDDPAPVARFSKRAPLLVAAIVTSGLFLARAHVARWPALLGTPYGLVLLAKLAAFGVALGLAARLRWRALPAALEARGGREVRRGLAAEAAFGAITVVAATRLADTVPAAHDVISWWLPFRFSIQATWGLPWVAARVGAGAVLLVCALALAAGYWRRGSRPRAIVTLALGTVIAGVSALPAISVPAFAGTYWTPTVPYHAVSVANGRRLYREHCVRCHGLAGRGDGPLAKEQPKPPANLTEPHTADHTAGDMFWWLTHGIEESGMPPFADVLTAEERWDLVNYLRAFASGHQGRILAPRVSPEKPWLGVADFNYRLASGERGLLRDFRGRSVVLLVFFTPGSSDARLAHLRELLPEIRRAGGEVLAVPAVPDAAAGDFAPLPIVAGGAEEAVEAYLLLRRTFADPGNDEDDDRPPHMELLIDRWGYARARWRPDVDPTGWSDDTRLLGEIAILAREPQILPPPDDHVH